MIETLALRQTPVVPQRRPSLEEPLSRSLRRRWRALSAALLPETKPACPTGECC